MSNAIIMFNETKTALEHEIGGKARSLVRMMSADFNVPNGFIVSEEMQSAVLNRYGIAEMVREERDNLLSEDLAVASGAAKRIRDAILAVEFTEEESKQIDNAVKELSANNNSITFAVRSSGAFEDGIADSWAGQFDTFLDVCDADVTTYIKHCWASMFGLRAVRYSSGELTGDKLPAFSVVVQIMINGDFSGIAFSVDPVDGNDTHARVETVSGVGDKIVGGQETPYSVVLGREDGLVLKRKFGSQGRVELLPPSKLREIMTEVLKIEILFGIPVDVEWTIKDGILYILQARPITAKQSVYKADAAEEALPDILNYELTFKVTGLGFMFADLLCRGFGYLHPLFTCNSGEFLQYFTNERMEYAARYGHRWLSTPGGFLEYKNEFTEFHNNSFEHLESIVASELTEESVREFYETVYQYFIRYSKMDFQFTNLTYLYADENPVIAQSLKDIAEFKDVARVWVNRVSIDDDSMLVELLDKIAGMFQISAEDLQSYKVNEIFDIFNGYRIPSDELERRFKNSIVMTDGRSIKYYIGDSAKEFIQGVEAIQQSRISASIIGQVANRNEERYITGVARLINVDYGNLEAMEQEIAEMEKGEILISEFTSPELMVACTKAKAIVTDLGGMLSHAAIVSRELGIPCVVGTEHASRSLKNGDNIRIDLDLGIVEAV